MRFSYCFFLLVFFSSVSAFAEYKPALMEGMSYYDVLNRWGPPKDKVIYESRREAQWLYKADTVRFKEGKVIKIAAIVDPWTIKAESEAKAVQAKRAQQKAESENEELLEIFEEIAEGYPDEDSAPQPGSPIENMAER